MTLYLVLTDCDIFESIMEKRSTWRSDIWVYFGIFFICLFKVLKIVWLCWNEWVGVNQLVFSQFFKVDGSHNGGRWPVGRKMDRYSFLMYNFRTLFSLFAHASHICNSWIRGHVHLKKLMSEKRSNSKPNDY